MALGDEDLLTIPFRVFVLLIAGLPLCALTLCLALSLSLHWEEATRTHCNVPNWLPSVSAAVASYSPERYIWRLLIGLQGAPRMALAFAFKNLLMSSPLRPFSSLVWFPWVCYLACAVHLAEIVFLMLLTSISSVEDYYLHKACFIGFLASAMVYMFLSSWLFDYSGRRRTTSLGEISFQYKVLCTLGSTICLLLSLYFFYRHNRYCEPGVYTFFALSEYGVILFNVLFHATLYYDFHSKSISLVSAGSTYQYEALPMHHSYAHDEKKTEKRT